MSQIDFMVLIASSTLDTDLMTMIGPKISSVINCDPALGLTTTLKGKNLLLISTCSNPPQTTFFQLEKGANDMRLTETKLISYVDLYKA